MLYRGSADIYITERCDEGCLFCSGKKGDAFLSLDDFKGYVENWVRYGTKHINMTGGEPLLHPRLPEFVRHAKSLGMTTALFTSGSQYCTNIYSEVLPWLDWLAISIDGGPEADRAVGRSELHFENAMKSFAYARSKFPSVKVRVATVVCRLNLDGVEELGCEMLQRKLCPDLWRIKQVIPVRRAEKLWESLRITERDYDSLTAKLSLCFANTINIRSNPWQSKSGDLIVTYPSGISGSTMIRDNGEASTIVMLGNIFDDFDGVISSWHRTVRGKTITADRYMNEAWGTNDSESNIG